MIQNMHNNEDTLTDESPEVQRAYTRMKIKMTFNFIVPVIIIFLHIPMLTRDYLVPDVLTMYQWEMTRGFIQIVLILS